MAKTMITSSKEIDALVEKMSNMEFDGIYNQWSSASDSIPIIINDEYISMMIEDKQEEIGLNDKWTLGHFFHALWFHDAPWLNVLILSEEQAYAWDKDFKEKYEKKLLFDKKNIQGVKMLLDNPYLMEQLNLTQEIMDDMTNKFEEEIESDLKYASLYEKPYKQKRNDNYVRKCEDNLWVEMTMQLEPSIPETKQLDFMTKLMGEFKYDSMHIEDKQFKYDTSSQRVRLKKRRQRALKDYSSSVFASQ